MSREIKKESDKIGGTLMTDSEETEEKHLATSFSYNCEGKSLFRGCLT